MALNTDWIEIAGTKNTPVDYFGLRAMIEASGVRSLTDEELLLEIKERLGRKGDKENA